MADGRYTPEQQERLGIPPALLPWVGAASYWMAVAKELGVPVTEVPRLIDEEPTLIEAVTILLDGRNRPDPTKPVDPGA